MKHNDATLILVKWYWVAFLIAKPQLRVRQQTIILTTDTAWSVQLHYMCNHKYNSSGNVVKFPH